jgi:hypothetical protein
MKADSESFREPALCAHLRSLEQALLDPLVRRDRQQVSALLADDFLEFGSSGRVWTRAEILDLLGTEGYQPPLMQDFACHWIAEGAVLVTYKAVRVVTASDGPTSGRRSETLRSSLWIRENEGWRVRFHQGTRVPE